MHKLILLSLWVLTFPIFAEHDGSESSGRSVTPPAAKKSTRQRLQEFVSACSNGRIQLPFGALDNLLNSPSPGVPGNGDIPGTNTDAGAGGNNGAALFETRCLKCHNNAHPLTTPANFSEAIKRVKDDTMPKPPESPLSAAEKDQIIAHLKSLGGTER